MADTYTDDDFPFAFQSPSLFDFSNDSAHDPGYFVSTANDQLSSPFSSAVCEPGFGPMASPESKAVDVFDTEAAPPQFHVSYQWWEEEALPILWAFNVADIKRVLRFRLYNDDESPERILQHRNTATLSEFVASLCPADHPGPLGLTHQEKVDEIVRLCQPTRFSISWNWFPSYLNDTHPATLAREIDMESIIHFKTVPFEDWVRYALGYPTMSVVWFVEQHRELYSLVSAHLSRYPERKHIYVEVEKHLRSACPWAHLALLQCLKDKGLANMDFTPDQRVANFLINPIQSLFESPSWPFVNFLKKLSVLSIRFARRYHENTEIDWSHSFSTGGHYLDELVASSPATALARRLTHSDEREFSRLSAQSFEGDNAKLRLVVNNWHALSTSVEECCLAFPEMPNYLQDCVKALLGFKNYYSATAMLHGLQEAQPTQFGLPPLSPQDSFDLLDPTDNYATYRRKMTEIPGLPFLHPHIAEYQSRGQEAVAGLFPLSVL